jgi:hypothetical protein
MRRPLKFEGFTHNRAVLRFPGFAGLSDSKERRHRPLPSGGFCICPDGLSATTQSGWTARWSQHA